MQRKELPRYFPLWLKEILTKKESLDGIFNIDELGLFSNQLSSKAYVSDGETWAQAVKAAGSALPAMPAGSDSGDNRHFLFRF